MRFAGLWEPVQRWGEFRRRQLAALEESNRIAARSVALDEGSVPAETKPPKLPKPPKPPKERGATTERALGLEVENPGPPAR